MKLDGYLSLQQAAHFLEVSRPTLNARRAENKLSEIRDGQKTLLKKAELLSLYVKDHPVIGNLNLVATEKDKIDSLSIDGNTLDLRKINIADAYGAISLLTASVEILEQQKTLYLIVSDTPAISTLCLMGFFEELTRRFEGRVFWNESDFPKNTDKGLKAFFPIKYIGFKGQERSFLDSLDGLLQQQGFDSDTIGYFSWFIGELADNALTHARGPCYVLIGQFSRHNKYLEIAIGDTGKGIHVSLKENSKYSGLSDQIAFIKAFQSKVSSWPDDKPRGKGLSDILSLAMGSGSLLRVDSKNLGLLFNFNNGQRELQLKKPASSKGGTRFCWVLENSKFKNESRQNVDTFIEKEIENRNEKNIIS